MTEEMNDDDWIIDAMAGNFATMPVPFTWDQSAAFAHLIDGYGVAGGVPECVAITDGIADFEPESGDRLTWAVHLWVALFGEHRRCRHGGGYPLTGEALRHANLLCEELREALQALDPDDLDGLRAVMAKHPGMAWRGGPTPDNIHISEVKSAPGEGVKHPIGDAAKGSASSFRAGSCTEAAYPGEPRPEYTVAALVESSIAESTRRAYRLDLEHFEAWGGRLPAEPGTVASYLAAHAETLSVATLVRRLATLSKAHEAKGLPNPCRSEIVRATLRGIKRTRGIAQRAAKPLLKEDLFRVLGHMGDSPKDARDGAILLLGFAGGFRRSELVGLDLADVERVRQGLIVTLRRSKTDQEGAVRKIGIPYGRSRHCPVAALDQWLRVSGIDRGPLFRPVDRHSRVAAERLSSEAVSVIVKERVAAAGIDPTGFSGHSLRAGFATSAVQAGVSTLKIRAQTGHASDAMLARYVRDGELFVDNAASALL